MQRDVAAAANLKGGGGLKQQKVTVSQPCRLEIQKSRCWQVCFLLRVDRNLLSETPARFPFLPLGDTLKGPAVRRA